MLKKRAVVIGGSVAGLAAARVLADHFAQVTILERDRLPDGPDHRKGVPQDRHVHALLLRGKQALDSLFPDLFPDLVENGAVAADTAGDLRWHHCGVYKKRFQSGLATYFMSRPFLEWRIRSHLLRQPNVTIQAETEVTRLLQDRIAGRVLGVELASGDRIAADLVVDASGRGSRVPLWLQGLGYPAVPVDEVKINIRYASRIYQMPERLPDWKACILTADPPQPRSGLVLPLEGNRWIVGLQGYFGNQPPTDAAGFLAFAQSLPTPDIYEAIREAEPLSEAVPGGLPSHLWRRYDRMDRHPEGLVAIGDALCSLNPVFASGMSLAAIGAETLGACLRESDLRHFRTRLAKQIDVAWQGATGDDLKFPETEGKRPPGLGLINWYARRIARASADDQDTALRFLRLMHLLEGPGVLFHPRTVYKALTAR